jgi:GxxExxY protein
MMLRVISPLDEQTEKCIDEAMDCGFAVHRALGPGFGESIYKNAFCVELLARQIPFECEKSFVIRHRDRPVGTHRLDLIVRERVVIELKAVKMLKRVHEAQVLAYLKASKLPVALLMNFGGATLKERLKRVVLHRI